MLRHRRGAGALAWLLAVLAVAVAVVAEAPTPAAARAAGCDADGDGAATGTPGVVLSDGADAAAARLAAEAGYALAPARPAWRWRVPVCTEAAAGADPAAPERAVAVVGQPVAEPDPAAPGWEAAARDRAVADLVPRLWRPGARTSPPVNGVQVVGLETWLAVDPAVWVPLTATAQEGEVSVTATATPTRTVWEFSDGVVRACDGPGLQYAPGAPGPAPCGRTFERTTEVAPVTVAVSIDYAIGWSSSLGDAGVLARRGEPNRYQLVVGEVQTYLTDGTRRAPPRPGAPPPPASSQPAGDDDCGWATPWRCSPADVIDALTDLAVDVVWAGLPGPVREAAGAVWGFLQGCAAFVGGAVASLREVLAQFGQLMVDPGGFVRDTLGLARTVFDAARTDPGGFAAEFLGGAVEVELLRSDPARWAGQIGCEIAVGILTGGAAASAGRFAGVFADLGRFAQRVRDWMRRDDGDGDDGGDGGGVCPTSSFPTGTRVLLADGSARPIEGLRPGEAVLAFDPATGAWRPRAVQRQWSYLDTDAMATLVLADGATVAATDHHRFWSATRAAFVEAAALAPGEVLATPAGPVTVAGVALWPSGPTLVWELTVAVDHTFAVLAGDHPVAVHNEGDCFDTSPGSTGSATEYARLLRRLQFEEAASIFTPSGGLQPSVIAASDLIIPGTRLNNPLVVKQLTADGSNIADWGKYRTSTFQSPSGPFQVHFYMNSTGAVNYDIDYKVKFNGPPPPR